MHSMLCIRACQYELTLGHDVAAVGLRTHAMDLTFGSRLQSLSWTRQ